MDIRKGNDVNIYFELSKLGVPSAESIKGIRCFFAKDVRSESGDVPVPPSCNPSSYVIHDHMHPCYNVHMPYQNIDRHVHREFSIPDNCPPGWHGKTVFVTTDYKIVNVDKEGESVPYIRTTFGGDSQRNGRYNVVLEIVFLGTDEQGGSDVKCTFDYGHQFDITDQPDAASGVINIWPEDVQDLSVKLDEEIARAKAAEEDLSDRIEQLSTNVEISDYFTDSNSLPYGNGEYYTYNGRPVEHRILHEDGDDYEVIFCIARYNVNDYDNKIGRIKTVAVFSYNSSTDAAEFQGTYSDQDISLDIQKAFGENLASQDEDGFMSSTDKIKLDNAFVNLESYVSQGSVLPNTGVYMYGGVNVSPIDYTYVDSQSNTIQYRIFKFEESESGDDTGYIVYKLTNVATNTYTHLGIYYATDSDVPYGVKEAFHDNTASTSYNGLMSKEDKQTLDGISNKISIDGNGNVAISTYNGISLNADTDIILSTAGGNDVKLSTDDGSVVLIVGSTTLELDETKLQRLVQLLA